ncbi:CbtA family protein [Zavarzinia aquatilis]|uniref:Cobalt transporter n=1 Tax=Zavarzinia aquatilis TaxID=2211142 RepID=A0A317DUU6_9PROT|nr:CbtA family protein [Zavarzinia aquatilis]PWR18172.1 hypothetical protein DKG74_19655 [Zavarzinia aquatilis]
MVPALLMRGMLIGILAGLLAFGFARVFGEPPVERAIALEGAPSHSHGGGDTADTHGAADEPELVSRDVQRGLGLLTGTVVYGAALGGILALVFAYAQGRLGAIGPRATAALLALAGFAVIYLVPQIKYPASPPVVSSPETIGPRTALYLSMVLFSLAAAVAALAGGRRAARALGLWNGAILGGALYLGAVTAAMLALPAVTEMPAEFPAALLWDFRLAAVGTQAVLWAALGLGFGLVAERRLEAARGSGLLRAA